MKFSAVDIEKNKQWLAGFANPAERVILVWSPSTALSMQWQVFVALLLPVQRRCRPLVEGGSLFLRWHHFEEFEYDPDAL